MRMIKARAAFAVGVMCFHLKRVSWAVQWFKKSFEADPDDQRTQLQLAWTLFVNGDDAESIQRYEALLQRWPMAVEAYFGFGCALQRWGRHDDAIRAWHQAIEHEPSAAIFHARLGDSLQAIGRMADAIDSYRRALRHDPADRDTLRRLLHLLRETRQPREAVEIYRILLR